MDVDTTVGKADQPRVPAGSPEGGEFASASGGGSGDDAPKTAEDHRRDYRQTHKGTNKANNAAVVENSGVKVVAQAGVNQDDVTEAVAHYAAEGKAGWLKGKTVEFKDLGSRLHGVSKGNRVYVSSTSLKDHGPGFAAGIIHHELKHTELTAQGVSSADQESRVRTVSGTWARLKYSTMAKTNPRAAGGFLKAATYQGR
jgi:hypothetical protein